MKISRVTEAAKVAVSIAFVSWLSTVQAATVSNSESGTAGKPASQATISAQEKVRAALPPDDGQDEEFSHRGFIGTRGDPLIRAADGHVVRDINQLDWISGNAPSTVNPSLWRQMKLFKSHGLFEVSEGVWQVRGFDISNMLIIRGKSGWIVADPLMTVETAAAAMKLVNAELGERPVSAVIYSHSHADHFGGVRGVVTPGTAPAIIAPEHFIEATVSESVLAGPTMSRRVSYQIGLSVPVGPRGNVGGGIMPVTDDGGTVSLLPPTDSITHTGETRVIDGVPFEFQMVPDSEAPSEMNFYLPAQHTLYIAEMTTCVMHNFQTPRGALVRDADRWAGYITEALELYGDHAESLATGHCWPRFGGPEIRKYLSLQRDNYKFIHDQTVRRMNDGATPLEIAEQLQVPAAIASQWSNRDYYGTVRHNAKGVYQRYIGWWDGVPADLDRYPPAEEGRRLVRAMGGPERVLREARHAMTEGDYRWSAEILNDLVFAAPDNAQARSLLADSYEQLGYQAESAIWRNIYLSGAAELRGASRKYMALAAPDVVTSMSTASLLEIVATRLNPQRAGERAMTVQLDLPDSHETALLSLRNAVLVPRVGKQTPAPDVTITAGRALLVGLFIRKSPLPTLETQGLRVAGDRAALQALLDAIDTPPNTFRIAAP